MISSYPHFKLQRYPLKPLFINNVEDIVFFLAWEVFNFDDNLSLFLREKCASDFCTETPIKNI